jgi:hypothetical protein
MTQPTLAEMEEAFAIICGGTWVIAAAQDRDEVADGRWREDLDSGPRPLPRHMLVVRGGGDSPK